MKRIIIESVKNGYIVTRQKDFSIDTPNYGEQIVMAARSLRQDDVLGVQMPTISSDEIETGSWVFTSLNEALAFIKLKFEDA